MRPRTATFFTNRTTKGLGWHPEFVEGADTKIRLHVHKDRTHIGIFKCTYTGGYRRKIDLSPLLLVSVHHRSRTYELDKKEGGKEELNHLGDLLQEFWPSNESLLSAYDLFNELEKELEGHLGAKRPIVFEQKEKRVPVS